MGKYKTEGVIRWGSKAEWVEIEFQVYDGASPSEVAAEESEVLQSWVNENLTFDTEIKKIEDETA